MKRVKVEKCPKIIKPIRHVTIADALPVLGQWPVYHVGEPLQFQRGLMPERLHDVANQS